MARERLGVTGGGQVRLLLRKPWADGTTHLVFDPVEFLGRLAVLVPRPRINLLLYHGVLGPRTEDTTGQGGDGEADANTPDVDRRRARGRLWADLMRRSLGSTSWRVRAATGACAWLLYDPSASWYFCVHNAGAHPCPLPVRVIERALPELAYLRADPEPVPRPFYQVRAFLRAGRMSVSSTAQTKPSRSFSPAGERSALTPW